MSEVVVAVLVSFFSGMLIGVPTGIGIHMIWVWRHRNDG